MKFEQAFKRPQKIKQRNNLDSLNFWEGRQQTHSIGQGLPLVPTSLANLPFTKPQASETITSQPSRANFRTERRIRGGNNAYHGDLLDIGVLLLVVLPELLPAETITAIDQNETKTTREKKNRKSPINLALT